MNSHEVMVPARAEAARPAALLTSWIGGRQLPAAPRSAFAFNVEQCRQPLPLGRPAGRPTGSSPIPHWTLLGPVVQPGRRILGCAGAGSALCVGASYEPMVGSATSEGAATSHHAHQKSSLCVGCSACADRVRSYSLVVSADAWRAASCTTASGTPRSNSIVTNV